MTYENAEFNADLMTKTIRHNLMTGGNARIIYDACQPEVQCLVRCRLELKEKQALGLVANEAELRRLAKEREARRFEEIYDTAKKLKVGRKKMYYDCLATP